MTRVLTILGAMGMGLLTAAFLTASAWAAPAISPSVMQTERFLDENSDIVKVHRWHCQARRGHYHPEACDGDPYDNEPYYEPYVDGGVPNVVLGPVHSRNRSARNYRRSCTRSNFRHCNRRWRNGSKRWRRCMRKYGCR